MNIRITVLGLILAILFLPGCGYRLVGSGGSLPSHIRTISIPVFKNTSSEPQIHRDLSAAIRDAFITDGRLKVVTRKPHLLLEGTLYSYEIRAIAFNKRDVATEYWVKFGVDIVVTDKVKGVVYLEKKYNNRWDYKVSENVVTSEAARKEALEEAYRDLADKLVTLIIERF